MTKITLEQYKQLVEENSLAALELVRFVRRFVTGVDEISLDELESLKRQSQALRQTDLVGQLKTLPDLLDNVEMLADDVRQMVDRQARTNLLLDKRFRERDCLNDISRKTDENPILPDFLEWVCQRIPAAMRYPDDCVVAIEFEGQVYGRAEAAELPWQIVQGLRIDDELLGRVIIAYTQAHDFLDGESGLLGDVVRRISGYIESRRLLKQTREVLDRTETLYQVSRSAIAFESLPDLLQSVVDSVAETLPAHRVSLVNFDQNRQQVTHFVRGGVGSDQIDPVSFDELLQGLSGWVLREREPALSSKGAPDPRESPQVQKRRAASDVGSVIVVPLIYRDQVIGTMTAINRLDDPDFTRRDVETMMAMANQVAVAIENARLLEETQRRLQEQQGLARVAALASSTLEIDELLDHLMQEALRLMDAETCVVLLADEKEQALIGRYVSFGGKTVWAPEEWRIPMDAPGFEHSIYARGGAYYSSQGVDDPNVIPAYRPFMEEMEVYNFCGVALRVRERSIGELYLANRPQGFGRDEIRLLRPVASYAASALENAHLFQQVVARAEELTALYELGQVLTARLDVDAVLEEAYRRVAGLLEAAHFYAVLYDQRQDQLTVALNVVAGEVDKPYRSLPAKEGITEHVLRTQKPLLVPDNVDERMAKLGIKPRRRPGVSDLGPITSWMGAPMVVGDRLLGMLALSSYVEGFAYTERDRDLLSAIASQTAIALQNAYLFEEVQEHVDEQSVLSELAQALTARLDVDAILDEVYRGVTRLLGADNAYVALYDEEKDEVTIALNVADGKVQKPDFTQPAARSITAHVLRQRSPLLIQGNLAERLREMDVELIRRPSTSRLDLPACWLGAPIAVGSELLGLLAVTDYADPRAYGEHDTGLLASIANQTAIALQNAFLFQETQQRSRELTALNAVVSTASQSLTLEEILDATLERAAQVMVGSGGLICLIDPDTDELRLKAHYNLPQSLARSLQQKGMQETLCEVTVTEGRTYHVPDLATETSVDTAGLMEVGLHAYLGTPLVARGRTLGTLSVFGEEPEAFSDSDIALLTSIGQQVGIAVRNAQLYQQTEAALAESRALYETGQAIAVALTLEDVLEIIVHRMVEHVGVDQSRVVMFDESLGYGRIVAEYEPTPGIEDLRIPMEGNPSYEVLRDTGQPVAIEDVYNHPVTAEIQDVMRDYGIQSMLLVPFVVQGRLVGSISLDANLTRHKFTPDEVNFCRTLADQAALTIENRRLFAQAQESLRETTMLYEASRALNRARDLPDVLNAIIDNLPIRQIDQCLIALFVADSEPGEREIEIRAMWDHEGDENLLGARFTPQTFPLLTQLDEINTYVIDDLAQEIRFDPQSIAALESLDIKSALIVPLTFGDTLLGWLLLLTHHETQVFDPDQVRPYQTLADQAAVALQNAYLFERTEAALAESTALYEAGQAIATATSLEDVFQIVIDYMVEYVDADQSRVIMFDETLGYGQVVAEYKPTPGIEELRLPMEGNRSYEVLRDTGEPIAIEDVYTHPVMADVRDSMRQYGVKSVLLLPFFAQGRLIGSVGLDITHTQRAFSESEINFCRTLTDQASLAIDNLRLLEETQRFASRLQIAAEISRTISAVLDPDQLMSEVVEMIRDRFDLYYVGLFLVDELGEWAVLEAGTGEAGRVQVEADHRLAIGGESMIGWSIANRQPRVAFDIGKDPVHFTNPYLPDTRSEMALPLISRDQAIGALTVQSHRPAAFSEEDIAILRTVADQIANALVNARLYTEAEDALQALSAAQRRYVQESWREYIDERVGEPGYVYDQSEQAFRPVEQEDLRVPEVERVLERGSLVYTSGRRGEDGKQSRLVAPIVQQGQVIGTLALEDPDGSREWSEDQVALVEAVATQVAQAVELARLFEQTQDALSETELLYDTSRAIGSAASEPEVVSALVENVRTSGLDRIVVALIMGEKEGQRVVEVRGVWDRAGQEERFLGNRFTADQIPLIDQLAANERMMIERLDAPDVDARTRATFEGQGVKSVAVLPIAFGELLLGWLMLETTDKERIFSDKDIGPYEALITQASVALQTQRLLDTTERRARRERTIREITDKIHRSVDLDKMLETTVRELGRALKASRTVVKLSVADLDETLTTMPSAEGDE